MNPSLLRYAQAVAATYQRWLEDDGPYGPDGLDSGGWPSALSFAAVGLDPLPFVDRRARELAEDAFADALDAETRADNLTTDELAAALADAVASALRPFGLEWASMTNEGAQLPLGGGV